MTAETNIVRFIINNLDVGDTEKLLSLILPQLASAEIVPVVITLTHKGELADKLECAGIKVYEPSLILRRFLKVRVINMIYGPVTRLFYLSYMFLKIPARLTCFYQLEPYILGGLASLIADEGNNTVMFRHSLNKYQKKTFLIDYIERFLHTKQKAIVGNSHAIVQELIETEGAPEDKVKLICNDIDISQCVDSYKTFLQSVIES